MKTTTRKTPKSGVNTAPLTAALTRLKAQFQPFDLPLELTSFKELDYGVTQANGGDLVASGLSQEQADWLIRVVNSHADLLGAAGEAVDMLEGNPSVEAIETVLAMLNAAIAKAEGRA